MVDEEQNVSLGEKMHELAEPLFNSVTLEGSDWFWLTLITPSSMSPFSDNIQHKGEGICHKDLFPHMFLLFPQLFFFPCNP